MGNSVSISLAVLGATTKGAKFAKEAPWATAIPTGSIRA